MIRFRPSNQNRRKFAAWASKHRLRTVTSVDFAVPGRLFGQIPARLLDGAIVDGQRITAPPPKPRSKPAGERAGEPSARRPKPSPKPEPAPSVPTPEPEPEPDLLPDLESETEDVPFDESGPVPVAEPPQTQEADPELEPGFLSLPEPPAQPDSDESPGHECDDPACLDCGGPQPAAVHECPECGRAFKSGHGLKIHVGRAHSGSEGES